MRVTTDRLQKVLLAAALIAALGWNLAHGAEVQAVRLTVGPSGTRAEISLDSPGDYRLISLAGPDRLVVDLPASSARSAIALPQPAGVVRSVRVGAPQVGTVRIVFDLSQPVAALHPQIEPTGSGSRLVIEWPGDFAPTPAAVTSAMDPREPAAAAPQVAHAVDPIAAFGGVPVEAPPAGTSVTTVERRDRGASGATRQVASEPLPSPGPYAPAPLPPPIRAPLPIASQPWPRIVPAQPNARPQAAGALQSTRIARGVPGKSGRALVIAIDAGHGGQDPGAHGPGGEREKDVTLAIARELARQVNLTPGYRAYLTRDTDYFIPLNQRARLAKQARADMFVSIHADAAENPAARGSSVFVLSLKGASSQRARWLADTENAADLIGGVKVEPGNTLASVLLDLTQSGNMRASEDAAGQVLDGLSRLGPNHKETVERANFAVLRTSDIPAMLVETAFISNPDEAERLTNPIDQQAIARAVLGGVNAYFSRQPPPGTLLAAQLETRLQSDDGAPASPGSGGR